MFEIKPRGASHPHMPMPLLDGYQTNTDIETIIDPAGSLMSASDMWDPGQERLGPYFLPPFQRPPSWTDAQKERFIESALLGIGLGSIVVVDAMNLAMQPNGRFPAVDRHLLDGQQRIRALLDYRHGRLTVLRGTPCEHRWDDLTEIERRKFRNIQIGVVKIQTDDPALCREIYNRMNFGGTAHTAAQMAGAEAQPGTTTGGV